MSAQNQLYKDIMELTSSQCKELHDELISMRLTTKQEITRLQGSLQVFTNIVITISIIISIMMMMIILR